MRIREKIAEFWKKAGKNRWLFLIGALGALLLLLAPLAENKAAETPSLPDVESYRATLTEELVLLCESVEGAGTCRVFLTLESGARALYEKNQTSSGQTLASLSGNAVLIGYEMPRVTGVAVVSEGGGSERVRYEISSLLSASLGISSVHIHISSSR